MKFPTINQDLCPPNIPGCGDVSSDARCADPDFAAANPQICGGTTSLLLKPGFAILCDESTIQFATFLRSVAGGEMQVTQGLVYTTSDASILAVDADTGAGTVLGDGIVTISVSWQGYTAAAQITVQGDGDCCEDVAVRTVVLFDASDSMRSYLSGSMSSATKKQNFTRSIIQNRFINTLNEDKDELAIVTFAAQAIVRSDFSSSRSALTAALVETGHTTTQTNLPDALDAAFSLIAAAGDGELTVQNVIVLISDGNNIPALTSDAGQELQAQATAFKVSGGLIICIGIRAGHGFAMLQGLSSGGFFLNIITEDDAEAAVDLIGAMTCLYCAGERLGYGYGYGCDGDLPGGQIPDPHPLLDDDILGSGSDPGDGGGGDLPRLPCPAFTPASGASIPLIVGLDVYLAVLGFPNARIRFTADGSAVPPDPSFNNPNSTPDGGIDYDGIHVPLHILGVHTANNVKVKVIARQSGYADSLVCLAEFIPP